MSQLVIFEDFAPRLRKKDKPGAIRQKKKRRRPGPIHFAPLPQKISINPDYFTIYNDTSEIRRKALLVTKNKVERKLDTGTLSRGGRARIKRYINHLFMISPDKTILNVDKNYRFKVKIVVITLTLPEKQKHEDSYVKNKMLKNFLDTMVKAYPAFSYVWRAESQENGNIHFHILTDHFVPLWYISDCWNRILWRNGYLYNYMAKKGHRKAPSTSVEKVKNEKDMARYMRKYMVKGLDGDTEDRIEKLIVTLKEEISSMISSGCTQYDIEIKERALSREVRRLEHSKKYRKIKGKLWGGSDNLGLRCYSTFVDGMQISDINAIYANEVILPSDYFTVFKIESIGKLSEGFSDYMKSELRSHYLNLFHKKENGDLLRPPNILYRSDTNYRYSKN